MGNGLEVSLVRSVAEEGALQCLEELGEFTFDLFLEEGLLRDVPVVGTLFGLIKAGKGVRDYLFAKKVRSFLLNTQDLRPEEREEFAKDIVRDPAQEKRVGEKVLMLLERHTDLSKSRLLGRLFSLYVAGSINYLQFTRLAEALDKLMMPDLRLLPKVGNTEGKFGSASPALIGLVAPDETGSEVLGIDSEVSYQALFMAGLLHLDSIPTIKTKQLGNVYRLTRIGKVMVEALEGFDYEDV